MGFISDLWDLRDLFGVYGIYLGFMEFTGFLQNVYGINFSDLPLEMNNTLPFQALKKHHDVELTKDDVGGSMIIVEVDPSVLQSDDDDTMITADDRSILKRNYDSESVGMLYLIGKNEVGQK